MTDAELQLLQQKSKARHRDKTPAPHSLEKSFMHIRKPFVLRPKKIKPTKPVKPKRKTKTEQWEEIQSRAKEIAKALNLVD